MNVKINGMLSPNQIAKAFHTSHKTVMSWSDSDKYEYPLVFQQVAYITQTENTCTLTRVPASKFWKWVQQNPEVVNLNKYIPSSLPSEPKRIRSLTKTLKDTLPPKRKSLLWTTEEDNLLKNYYFHEGKTYKECASLLDRPPKSIYSRLKTLGEVSPDEIEQLEAIRIKIPYEERIDDKSLNYLKDNYGKLDTEILARKLKTTVKLIEKVAYHHGFSSMRVNQGYVTPHQIAKAFGIDCKTVKKWRELTKYSRPIPFIQLPNTRKSQGKYEMLGIEPEQMWNWVKENLDHVDLRKYTPLSINPEPIWFQNALKTQRRNLPSLNRNRGWNQFEDKELWYLYYSVGLSQKDIATKLDKTVKSIEKRLKHLRELETVKNTEKQKKFMVPFRMTRRNWTVEQDRELWNLFYNQGLIHQEISQKLGKSLYSVRNRLKLLRKLKMLKMQKVNV